MKFPYSVLMVGAYMERLIYVAIDKKAACEAARACQGQFKAILYIVVNPDGSRMSINDQKEYLK